MIAWLKRWFRRKPIPQQAPAQQKPVRLEPPAQPVPIKLELQVRYENGRIKTRRVPVDV